MSKKYLTSKLIVLILILAASFLLVFLNPRGFFSPFRQIFFGTIYPLQKTLYLLSRQTRELFDFLGSISDLKKENELLIKENDSLSAKAAQTEQEKKENETLREQLGLTPRAKFDLEASYVIGQDPQQLGSWMMIDKGSFSGLKSGMPVIVSDGILIGRVEEVFPKSSRVNLLTSPNSSVNVMDLETGAKGIIRGEFGLGVIMDMVSQTDVLNEGDSVTTSGLGSDVPRGLLVGKIQKFQTTEDKLFQQALIALRVKYSRLDIVFVIKNTK
jgi:rod shape-determining protein MreC